MCAMWPGMGPSVMTAQNIHITSGIMRVTTGKASDIGMFAVLNQIDSVRQPPFFSTVQFRPFFSTVQQISC